MITFAQLITTVSVAQARANLVALLVGLGIPADQWRVGGTLSTMLTAVATTYSNFTSLFAGAIASGFLTTASGAWLSWVALYIYGLTRPPATFASGNVTMTNTGGATLNYAAGAFVFGNPTTGAQYTNTASFSSTPGGAITIPVQATAQGAASSAAPGQITVPVTSNLGITVTNPSAVTGSDAMSDPNLVALCLARLQLLSPGGAPGAYTFAVLTAMNGTAPVNLNRVSVSMNDATGTVTVYVASPSGVPSSADVAAAQVNVSALATPDGVTAIVAPATAVNYSPQLTVYAAILPGVSAPAILAEVQAILVELFAQYQIGGLAKATGTGLWATTVSGAISLSNLAIYAVDGATDLVMTPSQVAVDAMPTPIVLLEAA